MAFCAWEYFCTTLWIRPIGLVELVMQQEETTSATRYCESWLHASHTSCNCVFFFYFLLLLQFPIKNLLYRYNNLSYANWSRWLRAITLLSVLSVRTCIIDYCIAILLKFVRHILTWFHIFWVIKRQSVWPLRKPQKKSQKCYISPFAQKSRMNGFLGALKMTDRKMTDRDIAGGGKCRTGIRRTKV